jgi:hypothetical protein
MLAALKLEDAGSVNLGSFPPPFFYEGTHETLTQCSLFVMRCEKTKKTNLDFVEINKEIAHRFCCDYTMNKLLCIPLDQK